MRTFVINLERSVERRENITRQLNAFNLPFEISWGVDAKNFTPEERAAFEQGLKEGTHSLPAGLFGSSWAHIKVYEKIVAEQIPVALVLEDDIIVSPEITRIIAEPWVQETFWEFVHLGYPPASWWLLRHWFAVSYQQAVQNPKFWPRFIVKAPIITCMYLYEMLRQSFWSKLKPQPVRFARTLYYGAGYLITLEGAKKLLGIAYPIHYTGDELFNRARKETNLKFYGYCPPPVAVNHKFDSEVVKAS
jgi:glycosyl transferase family 25